MGKTAFAATATVLLIAFMLTFAGCASLPPVKPGNNSTGANDLKSFKSWNEITSFVDSAGYGGLRYGYGINRGMMDLAVAPMAKATGESSQGAAGATDYSKTNVQVEGVDEADIVKNDGKYIYAVSGNDYYGNQKGKISIIDAYPSSGMKVVSEINVEGSVQQIFIYKDKLVAFGSENKNDFSPPAPPTDCANCIMPPYSYQNFAVMRIYDVSDRQHPRLEKEVEVKGSYKDSRMIDGKVYAIFEDYVDRTYPVPLYMVNGKAQSISPSEISYFDWPDGNYNYNIFVGIDLNDLSKQETRKVVMMGYSQNLYVSKDNMYVTYTKYDYYTPVWKAYEETYGMLIPSEVSSKIKEIDAMNVSDWRKDRLKTAEASKFAESYLYNESRSSFLDAAQRALLEAQLNSKIQAIQTQHANDREKTVVNRISLDGFDYTAKGEVPGHVLNQFSMDENNGYFRLATTISSQGGPQMGMRPVAEDAASRSSSSVYVLDSSLDISGKIEGIAPGESIYSARFMGDRLYLVTFKQVDPFFVIDLADPANPKLLGKLKIPGYSDYLHPYDSTHIIGIGKDVDESIDADKVHTPGAVYYTAIKGVKLSLFDVSDVSSPKEIAKYVIGDRGTDSYALQDHKAFLFSKDRNLLVIPITLAQIDKSKYAGGVPTDASGDFVFQGAYVFSLTPESGFVLRGRVTHATQDELMKSGEYFWSGSSVKRSLYMDNSLYTVSGNYVKANDLSSLAPISSVQIANSTGYGPVYYQ